MTAWKNLIGNSNLIVAETAKATLIKVPNTNFVFWHPSKLVRTSGMSDQWIMKNIGMDADELLRLKQISGLAALFKNREFSRKEI